MVEAAGRGGRARTAARIAASAALLLNIAVAATGDQGPLEALRQPPKDPAGSYPAGSSKAPLDLSQSTSELEMAAALLLRGYQVFLSSQDGPRCQFTPSCSEYARMVIRRHGLLAGLLMASDRYQRCNGLQRERYPLDPRTGKRLDPPPETPW
jgi:putative membrane protein insertion efficiency factor